MFWSSPVVQGTIGQATSLCAPKVQRDGRRGRDAPGPVAAFSRGPGGELLELVRPLARRQAPRHADDRALQLLNLGLARRVGRAGSGELRLKCGLPRACAL